ncbi:MAG: hypothetical protein R3F43_11790 [bacterium]
MPRHLASVDPRRRGGRPGAHPALYAPVEPEGDGPACATPPLGHGLDWSTPLSGLVVGCWR